MFNEKSGGRLYRRSSFEAVIRKAASSGPLNPAEFGLGFHKAVIGRTGPAQPWNMPGVLEVF